ncbi:MAG: hypothetical protein JWO77_1958 [Ilumatobacteraceae bacterium]|nr:hypothetical protein [Ilumatobacteraceae bacterium]
MITTLHDPVATADGGTLRLEVSVTFAPGTLDSSTVCFEVQPGAVGVADASVLPLVPAAVVLASGLGQDLRVTEPLPPTVHDGARRVGELLRRWYGWRPAELIAPLGPDPVRPGWAHRRRGLGVFFTRGVDSWGTLLALLDGPMRRRPTHLVTLDNEVHLAPAVRQAQLLETQQAADRIGLPLIVVRTDVRSLLDPHTDWGTQTHGSVLAGTGMLLRHVLREVVISPTHWTPLVRPWGSHPELDPAWSLPDLAVTHHSGAEMRWRRVERIVADPVAADTLLVCWQGTGSRNCGRCEKCLRLLTTLHLLEAIDRTAHRFDEPFDAEAIDADLVVSPHPWCDTMDHLDRVGLRADPLRQRWERVSVLARPAVWVQTRPRQPRLPVVIAEDVPHADHRRGIDALGRRLAALGLRIDHDAVHRAPDAGAEPALRLTRTDGGGWAVLPNPGAVAIDPIPLPALVAGDLDPLLAALGLDPGAVAPFDPDGQDPPPAIPEPPGWVPPPDDGAGSHR